MQNLRRIHSGLAHDLRGPFNAVFLQLELLKLMAAREAADAGAPSGTPPGAKRQINRLEQVESELERLRSAIEALVSQFESDAGRRTFDLSTVVRELGELTASQADKEGVAIVVQTAAPLRVSARLDLIRSSIFALVLWAMDSAAEGGSLSLETTQDDDEARLEVSVTLDDSGSPSHVAQPDIIREILQSQGASLDQAAADGGIVWRLRMPLAASS